MIMFLSGFILSLVCTEIDFRDHIAWTAEYVQGWGGCGGGEIKILLGACNIKHEKSQKDVLYCFAYRCEIYLVA